MSKNSNDGESTPLISSSGNETDVKIYSPRECDKPKDESSTLSVRDLFRFATGWDKFLMVIGTFASIVYGAALPAQYLILGKATEDFTDYMSCSRAVNCTDYPDIESSMMDICYMYIGYAFLLLFVAWLATACYGTAAERQCQKMRKALFRSFITQGVSWFDSNDVGNLNTRLSNDINNINDGMGQKFARVIQCVTTFVASYAIGFYKGWKLSLVMLSSLPLLFIAGGLMTKLTSGFATKEMHAYSKAGQVVEEVISAIKTVAIFGGEKRESARYNSHLDQARKFGVKKGFSTGISMCVFQVVGYSTFGLGFWYGTRMVIDDEITAGDLFTIFFSMVLGNIIIGQAGPGAQALTTARATAYEIFHLIDQEPELDPLSSEGSKPSSMDGDIKFDNVNFYYPSRTDIQILHNFSLNIPCGKTVALVGESGCGKSTVIKLIQRFYGISAGKILIDGQDITSFNLKWLRQHIAVVSQEPVLFSTTIAENIGYGRDGATLQEIKEAAIMANAHDFITQFPMGYDTLCGERGAQMSGGQKQRIAIARALIRNPTILLLDEATSALDLQSEAVVQDALDKAKEGRTTIIIAHRLSTIRGADVIVSVDKGTVSQIGSHDELISTPGIYSDLVTLQQIDKSSPQDDDDEKEECIEPGISPDQSPSVTVSTKTDSNAYGALRGKEGDPEDILKPAPFIKILKKNKTEWLSIILGIIGAAIYGSYTFVFAFLLGEFVGVFSYDADIPEEEATMRDESEKWSLFFVALGVGSGIGALIQNWMFARAGEALTKRFREEAFIAYLRQNIGFFDDPEHSTGAISARLATSATDIQGAAGSRLGLFVSGMVTITGSFIVAFISGWQLTLVALAFFPFLVFSGTFLHQFYGTATKTSMDKEAGKIVTETFSNIQTVTSLGREQVFYENYCVVVEIPYKRAIREVHLAGLTQSFTQVVFFLCFGACFRYAGKLLVDGDVTFEEAFKTMYAVSMCGIVLGELSAMAPDYLKARRSAAILFQIIESVPTIDSFSETGLCPEDSHGHIEFKRVKFRYPHRKDVMVLRGLNVCAKPGQTIALVGSSGCGKSTTLALLERFYDATKGTVVIDGNNIKALNIPWLRRQIGVVSQEPVLFDLTIGENIAYGDNTRDVSQDEIEEAAKLANIHTFIMSLPMGYDTRVGDKGTLISGGQKQRIAIARALIRNPKMLLLDEATSALDTESEKVVQEALDRASEGRTTLVIAHRLSTIRNADSIVVLKSGQALEQGTHEQLMALKQAYYILQKPH